MKPTRSLFFLLLLGTALLTVKQDAFAKGGKGGKGGKGEAPSSSTPASPALVTSLKGNTITLGSKTYTITQFTEIIVNGVASPVSAVKVGMEGNISVGGSGTEAARINVHAPTSQPGGDSDKKKKKK